MRITRAHYARQIHVSLQTRIIYCKGGVYIPESWRKSRFSTPNFNKKELFVVPATKFFDQLSFIGNEFIGCFMLETEKGLVLFDCLNQDEQSISILENGISDLGKNICQLRAIIISHGHGDHFGKADYFQKKYGANIYMSKIDYEFAKNMPKELHWDPIEFEVNHFLEDGEILDFGDIQVNAVFTPGHSPGCFSFLLPVTDEGRPHMMALWGGAGIMSNSNADDYLKSWKKFSEICQKNGVDGEIATHPFLDMGVSRLEMIRNISDGIPNPFVLGEEGYRYYEKMFYDYALKHLQSKFDAHGDKHCT